MHLLSSSPLHDHVKMKVKHGSDSYAVHAASPSSSISLQQQAETSCFLKVLASSKVCSLV
jgi:hypothetical protein